MTSLHPTSVRLSVASPELATALDSVRFAAGNHAELPTPSGILFDCEEDVLHLVATDRYRMAVAPACTTGHDGPRTRVVVPLPLADAMRALHAKQGLVKFLGSYPAAGDHAHSAREHADARWRDADDWIERLRGSIR